MNCETITEFILTDYIDGQLDGRMKSEVEAHLSSCVCCQELLKQVRTDTIQPFAGVQSSEFSKGQIWQRITKQINPVKSVPKLNPFEQWLDFIKGVRIAFAFSVIGVVVLSIVVMSRQQIARQSNEPTYLAYVVDELSGGPTDELDNYGTEIEEYFL